jgi:DNA-binding PadR family transcriptional regulator
LPRAGFRPEEIISSLLLKKSCFFHNLEDMADRGSLGEFDFLLLLIVLALGDEAYGVPIARELERYRGRAVAVGSVYAALERLEEKKMVASTLGDPTPERGGRARRYFRLTREGLKQVRQTRRLLTRLWQSIPELGDAMGGAQ